MKPVITASRIIVGVLFIFSGLIKADDPLGLSYKMQEFFEVWGWTGLYDFTLALSVAMIFFEVFAGVALLVGWQMKLFSWLLLLLTIFFTFLTGYALFSGKIRECGCFGNCIPLTAQQSFIKDLVLLLLILLLFFNRDKLRAAFKDKVALSVLVVSAGLTLGFQWYVLRHLPVIDCLPYKIGTNIQEAMRIPPGAIPDSTVISFVYNKGGKEVEFTADNFPADFSDSLYQFVTRRDKLIRKGNAEPAIKDFVLLTGEGADTTQAVLGTDGYKALFFTKGIKSATPQWLAEFQAITQKLQDKNIQPVFVTSDFDNVTNWLKQQGRQQQIPVLKCDFVAIKTAARSDPALFLLDGSTIVNKWSYADFDRASKKIDSLPADIKSLNEPIRP
ncbi:MAG: DoxX family protein [Williamsia sp.]|nr:DoxX family protein [Williamsia sp.]